MFLHLTTKKAVAAAAVAALAVTSAAVAAGAVADAAANGLAKASEQSGLTLPQADNEHRADASDGAGTAKTSTDDVEAAGSHEDTHGAAVSDLAQNTELEGAEKGAAVASLASDGRSDAEHGPATAGEAAATGAEASEARAGNADAHRP